MRPPGRYPRLVETAWDVVETFLADWQSDPYRWSMEADVQAELASRLESVYRLTGFGRVEGRYKHAVPGFEDRQCWSRVACEPVIWLRRGTGRRSRYHPDLVVWADLTDPDHPPDAWSYRDQRYRNWPIEWLCEIKSDSVESTERDEKKALELVKSGEARWAMSLELKRSRVRSGPAVSWESRNRARFWKCRARLPPLARNSLP